MTAHPNVRTSNKSTPPGEITRAILYGPEAQCERWMEELSRTPIVVQVGRTVANVVAALIEDPPPRPQILIADLDAMTPGEIMHLHSVRDQGWLGTMIVVGDVPKSLQTSLLAQVVHDADNLREAIGTIDHGTETVRIPRITG